jgi:hypothetical protein
MVRAGHHITYSDETTDIANWCVATGWRKHRRLNPLEAIPVDPSGLPQASTPQDLEVGPPGPPQAATDPPVLAVDPSGPPQAPPRPAAASVVPSGLPQAVAPPDTVPVGLADPPQLQVLLATDAQILPVSPQQHADFISANSTDIKRHAVIAPRELNPGGGAASLPVRATLWVLHHVARGRPRFTQ